MDHGEYPRDDQLLKKLDLKCSLVAGLNTQVLRIEVQKSSDH